MTPPPPAGSVTMMRMSIMDGGEAAARRADSPETYAMRSKRGLSRDLVESDLRDSGARLECPKGIQPRGVEGGKSGAGGRKLGRFTSSMAASMRTPLAVDSPSASKPCSINAEPSRLQTSFR